MMNFVRVTHSMKAIGFYQYGESDVLKVLDVPAPTPEKGQVLVKVMATGVNPADWRTRAGQFKMFMRPQFPFITGIEISGIISELGEGVTQFKIGDPVYGMLSVATGGGCAEYVAVNASALACMPKSLTFTQAASVPLTALTALQALRDKMNLKKGQHILIYGASGGVGMFTVQLAKSLGAKVTAVCSTRNVDWVKSLGADEVIDYTTTDILQLPRQYDAILDVVNYLYAKNAVKILKREGTFVTVSPVVSPIVQLRARMVGKQVKTVFVKPIGDDLSSLNSLFDTQKMTTYIAHEYSFEQAYQAHEESAAGHVRGKLVIRVGEQA